MINKKLISLDSQSQGKRGIGCGRVFALIVLGIFAFIIGFGTWRYFSLMGYFADGVGDLSIYDEVGTDLNASEIEIAASRLREGFGIDIEIYIFENMDSSTTANNAAYQNFLTESKSASIPENKLVFVIGIEDQYSEITWGARLGRLEGAQIRREALNPNLRDGDYTGALVASLQASSAEMSDVGLALITAFFEIGNYAYVFMIGAIMLFFGWIVVSTLKGGNRNFAGSYSQSDSSSNSYWDSSSSSSWSSSDSWSGDSGSSDSGGSDSGSWSD